MAKRNCYEWRTEIVTNGEKKLLQMAFVSSLLLHKFDSLLHLSMSQYVQPVSFMVIIPTIPILYQYYNQTIL